MVSWSIVFIVDPWILLTLILALAVPAILGLADREIGAKKKPFRGRGWAIAALILIASYWLVRNAERGHALALIRSGTYTREPLIRSAAEPHIANPFRWRVIMETEDYFQTAEVNTIGDQVETDEFADVIYKTPVTPQLQAAKQSYMGRVYLDWVEVAHRGGSRNRRAGARRGCATAGLAHSGISGPALWLLAPGREPHRAIERMGRGRARRRDRRHVHAGQGAEVTKLEAGSRKQEGLLVG